MHHFKSKGGQGRIDINNPREHNYKLDKDGYKELCLSEVENGIHKRYYRRMHRFVYETIVGEIPEGLTIDHDNMRRTDNHICNLNVMTIEENTRKEKEYGIPRYILYNGNNCIGLINRLTLEYILGFKLADNIIYEGNYDTFIWKRITK